MSGTKDKFDPAETEGRARLRELLLLGDIESLKMVPRALGRALDVIDNAVDQEDRLHDDLIRAMKQRNDLQARIDKALETYGQGSNPKLGQSRWRSADEWLIAIRKALTAD